MTESLFPLSGEPAAAVLPSIAGILAFLAGKYLDRWKERSSAQAAETAAFYTRQGQLLDACETDRDRLRDELTAERTAHGLTRVALAESESARRLCELRAQEETHE